MPFAIIRQSARELQMKISLKTRQGSHIFVDVDKPNSEPNFHECLEVAGEIVGLLAIGTLGLLMMVVF